MIFPLGCVLIGVLFQNSAANQHSTSRSFKNEKKFRRETAGTAMTSKWTKGKASEVSLKWMRFARDFMIVVWNGFPGKTIRPQIRAIL
jgi:hypothetical protein